MQNQIPSDLIDVRNLFERSIYQDSHIKRIYYFEDALDTADDYYFDNPETPYRAYIENLKETYTKKLIDGLQSIQEPDVDVFVQYVGLIEVRVNKEFRRLCEKAPNVEDEYNTYLDFFRGFITES